jgi:enoyl-CoA hydratase/carnithine racemase
MAYSHILLDIDGPIATITLNRPEKMNAFTGTMMVEMCDALDKTDGDDSIHLPAIAKSNIFMIIGCAIPGAG